jgi:FkbM family methyltransferase
MSILSAGIRKLRRALAPPSGTTDEQLRLDGSDASNDPATTADLYYCYRLFLRRNPDPTGWGAYADQISKGLRLADLIAYFVGCPEWVDRRLYKSDANTAVQFVEGREVDLYVMRSDPVVAREIIATREYEPHVTRCIKQCLRPGSVFVDVGANVGFHTLLGARIVGDHGKVFALEPNPDNVKVLALNARHAGASNVKLYPFAASASEGLLSLMSIVSIGSTKGLTDDDLRYLGDVQVVYSVTLDGLLARESRVDLVKCDVDGHDLQVMRGSLELLRRARPSVIAEFNPGTLRTFSEADPSAYVRLFLDAGYEIDVLLRSGEVIPCGREVEPVFAVLERTGLEQVDLFAHHPSRPATAA